MNFSVPFNWGAPDPDHEPRPAGAGHQDPELAAIMAAAAALSKKEQSLVLVLIQTISAWGGLQEGANQR